MWRVVVVILESSDVEQLNGYVRSSAQARWLRRHGWRFTVNALGAPVVALAEFNRHLVGGRSATAPQEPDFNWDAINGTSKKAG
jgi:6-phosphogluconate dehydrogenase (decarboxylating)